MYIGPSDHLTSDLSWILFIKLRLVPQDKVVSKIKWLLK